MKSMRSENRASNGDSDLALIILTTDTNTENWSGPILPCRLTLTTATDNWSANFFRPFASRVARCGREAAIPRRG
jgi:hypothetical protein